MVVVLTITILSIVVCGEKDVTLTVGLMKFDPRIVMSTLVPTTPEEGVTLVMVGVA
jgi:hypothetical protein